MITTTLTRTQKAIGAYLLLASLASLCPFLSAKSEGLPITGSHLTCKKIAIKLTTDQIKEVQAHKRIKLTEEQRHVFETAAQYVPPQLFVMSLPEAREADSCELEDIGILTSSNVVEVPDFLLGKHREERQPHVPTEQIHSWGFIDTTGNEVIPLQFREASSFEDGIASVDVSTSPLLLKDDRRFIDKTGKFLAPPEVPPKFTTRRKFPMSWEFHEGLAIFEDLSTKKYGFVDDKGKIAIPAKFDEAYILDSGFHEGLSAVKQGGKWGFIDKSGSFAVAPRFEDARQFHDGLAAVKLSSAELAGVYKLTPGSRWTFVDHSGRIWKQVFVAVHDFSEGLTAAEVAEPKMTFSTAAEMADMQNLPLHKQIFKTSGERLLPTVFDDVGKSCEGMIPIRQGRLVGFINSKGETVIQPQFLAVDSFSEGLAPVAVETNSGTQLGFVDETGKMAIPAKFPLKYIDFKMWLLAGNSRFHNGFALVQVDDHYGYLDRGGNWLVQPRFDQAKPFSEGLAAVCHLTRNTGKAAPPPEQGKP